MAENYKLPLLEIFASAWSKVRGTKATFMTVLASTFLVIFILEFLAIVITPWLGRGASKVILAIAIILQLFMSWSLLYIGVRRAANVPIRLSMVKEVLSIELFLKMIGLYLLFILLIAPTVVLPIAVTRILHHSHSYPAIIAAVILHVLWSIVLAYLITRVGLAKAIVVMERLMPWTAIKKSFKATEGNVLLLFGFIVVVVLFVFVSILPMVIGFIWSIPFMLIAYGEVYLRLVVQRTRN
jgi:hypothetical protein